MAPAKRKIMAKVFVAIGCGTSGQSNRGRQKTDEGDFLAGPETKGRHAIGNKLKL